MPRISLLPITTLALLPAISTEANVILTDDFEGPAGTIADRSVEVGGKTTAWSGNASLDGEGALGRTPGSSAASQTASVALPEFADDATFRVEMSMTLVSVTETARVSLGFNGSQTNGPAPGNDQLALSLFSAGGVRVTTQANPQNSDYWAYDGFHLSDGVTADEAFTVAIAVDLGSNIMDLFVNDAKLNDEPIDLGVMDFQFTPDKARYMKIDIGNSQPSLIHDITVVPEPVSVGVGATGALAMLLRRRPRSTAS